MFYVGNVVIATLKLEDPIERTYEVFAGMKSAGLIRKATNCEIMKSSIKYLGGMLDKHGIRPSPEAAEVVLTRKSPKTEHQLISFLGIANYYRELIKGYTDMLHPMQQLMRHKEKISHGTMAQKKQFEGAEEAFRRMKEDFCETP